MRKKIYCSGWGAISEPVSEPQECRSYYNFKRREKTFNTTVSVGTLTFFKNLPDR
ncbi:hypothetical protein [Leptospira borgpetersenii]|uniref:hypothetical protein n=1 Tax=Leptospira borgpetersenii TaxID=174 RepID=UPI00138ABA27|nr:hypothetical protein [Leptospira borgpetersenii]MBE8375112.1 hypothetical protein [Leptospira borgpetersenii serovar Hardjo-bovis]MBE8384248.1 hypothetical protein [Leptospira borgpetersenii serovar Hardjo-bovis]MBE8391528.1 hypothetical protein [Leptospira borgpetersenii serovar Hardjo-bovis]MBE8394617.1 hypothetical protein [Leptospira borgpetersenii serovar Hardjo-bovis]